MRPLRQDRYLVTHQLDLSQQVAGQEDRASLGPEDTDQLAYLAYPGRIQPVGRFVQDQDFGILEQRDRETEPLPHSQ